MNQAYKNLYTIADNEQDKALALRVFDEVGEKCGSVVIEGNYISINAPSSVAEPWMNSFPKGWAGLEKSEWAGDGDFFWKVNISKGCYHAARQ